MGNSYMGTRPLSGSRFLHMHLLASLRSINIQSMASFNLCDVSTPRRAYTFTLLVALYVFVHCTYV